jgi:RNA polymerase sigma-70 factor, ECF subfamily
MDSPPPASPSSYMNTTTTTLPFELAVEPHRAGLRAHCYRMLGSAADAEDALQETLLRAWRGMPGFEGRSSLRGWLYRIATNVCLRLLERRPKRVLPFDYGPAADPHDVLEESVAEPLWLEPYADEPDARYEARESVELAFVAALQHLPARQRAVLLLRDVLGFAPAEIAAALDSSPASVYSALQRAHEAVATRVPAQSQQATLREIGDERLSELVERYVAAWERSDVDAIVALLAEDATLAMPPRPGWYRGRTAVGAFLAARPLSRPRRWQRVAVRANGQPGFGVYVDGTAHAIEVLTFADDVRIAGITAFFLPAAFAGFGLPEEIR